MKKLLGIVVLGLLLSSNAILADYFKYKEIIICGPKVLSNLDTTFIPPYEADEYYYIHIAETDHSVIYNNEFQYATFEKKRYSQLWIQNHKITSLKLRKDKVTNVYQFELISEYDQSHPSKHRKRVEFFNLNIESMTFSRRRVGYPQKTKYQPATGVCWKVLE